MITKNPFYQLCARKPSDALETVLDAIAASVAHDTWAELYAARRAAYKATDTYLCGDAFSGRTFAEWFGDRDDGMFEAERTGYQGLWEVRNLAHEFLEAIQQLKG